MDITRSLPLMGWSLYLLFGLLYLSALVQSHYNPLVSRCPGEGPRYGDYKCIHDRTHRVCAKLVDNSNGQCNELSWGAGSFWEITHQERWNWKDRICAAPNPGDSWCICLWATANLISEVGCENVHIDCAATDVNYVKSRYYDYRWSLSGAKECIEQKCELLPNGKYVNRDSQP